MVAKLQREYQKLQDRIDAMYVDTPDVGFPRNSLTVKIVIGALTRLKFFTRSKNIKMQTALTWKRAFGFFELAQKAVSLYEKQEMKEKRRILDFLFSNCLWKDGDLIPNFRKPFDILALTNSAYQTRKAASRVKSGLSEIWLPGRDSNPRPIG
jgi:site-specific DNA recombinase